MANFPKNIVIGQEKLVAIEIQNGFLCFLDKQSTRMETGSHNVGI